MKEKKKFNVAAFVVLMIFVAATVAIYAFYPYIYGESSVFNQTISDNGFIAGAYNKIPALLASIRIIAIAWALAWLLRVISHKTFARSNRGTTIVRLVNSFVKYIVAIIALLLILNAWGVDAAALWASAGILSLIIGLGAQSLISDIIAGVFIVFEGDFQVGDIVIIDGWRGTVDEIGIRTTKIIDWQGNIKILNNSAISSIINQTKELSVTTCVVSIAYQESIPQVELVIQNNLDRLKAAIPEIIDGPYYKGVDKLNDSSVDLLFVATVKESDYYVVQRALNREIKILFDENGINIPFPQVTVNQPENFAKKASAQDEEKASSFNVQQRTVSKRMENTNK